MQETVPGVIKTLLVFASSKYIGHLGEKKNPPALPLKPKRNEASSNCVSWQQERTLSDYALNP